jgi:hypothetical protein
VCRVTRSITRANEDSHGEDSCDAAAAIASLQFSLVDTLLQASKAL